MKVVLFCGGLGMRMRESATSVVPKPMAMVGERPLLWHVMRYYAHFGHTDFVLCLGYGAIAVKDFFLNYDETRSNDFVLENGAREVKLFNKELSEWRVTCVDTGLNSPIGERLRRVRGSGAQDHAQRSFGEREAQGSEERVRSHPRDVVA